ncbi:hypothetical protein ACFO6V_07090 [Promicromonospora alba]|uniref:SMODS and SLOG-associating 2TM effector domain-containing protein n=1 Tax=Promicromonospora alba TaxID=1616110 RepID=A0ABV9HEJ5_9MICO
MQSLERSLARQQWRMDSAKVITVFALGTATAASVASWQELGRSGLNMATCLVLLCSLLLLFATYNADRLEEPDAHAIMITSRDLGWTDGAIRDEFLRRLYECVLVNEDYLREMYWFARAQVLTSVVSAVLSCIAMLGER